MPCVYLPGPAPAVTVANNLYPLTFSAYVTEPNERLCCYIHWSYTILSAIVTTILGKFPGPIVIDA